MKSYTWEQKWKQLQSKIKQEWNELTNDEIQATKGRKKLLISKIQEKYDLSADIAEKKLSELYRSLTLSEPKA